MGLLNNQDELEALPPSEFEALQANAANRETAQQLQNNASQNQYGDLLSKVGPATSGPFIDQSPGGPSIGNPTPTSVAKVPAGQSPIPQIPWDLHPVLAQRTAVSDDSEDDKKSDPDAWKKYLMEKYSIGNGQDDLKAAQGRMKDAQNNANLGNAFATIANGLAGGRATMNNEFFERIGNQGKEEVQNILQQRAAKEAGLKNETEIGAAAHAENLQNPNSDLSKAFQAQVARLYPGKYDPQTLSSFPAADSDKLLKPLELDEAAQARKALMQMNLQMRQMMMQNQLDEKEKGYIQDSQHHLETALKPYYDTDKELAKAKGLAAEAAAGNPQAGNDLFATIQPLLTDSKRLQPNWIQHAGGDQSWGAAINRWQQKRTTGMLDQHDIQIVQALLGNVEQTNAAEKAQLSEHHVQQLSKLINKPGDWSRTKLDVPDASQTQGKSPSTLSPQDKQAVDWAQSNKQDPRAQKILSLHGMQ